MTFIGCFRLETIKIPKSVKYIKDGAFYGCRNLETISFEKNSLLENIENFAFYDCSKLSSMFLPKFARDIKSSAFFNCKNLNKIIIEAESSLIVYSYNDERYGDSWNFRIQTEKVLADAIFRRINF